MYGKPFHGCDDPWFDAPPWAIELGARQGVIIHALIKMIGAEGIIMGQLDDALAKIEQSARDNQNADDAAEQLILNLGKMVADLKGNQTDPDTLKRIDALSNQLTQRAAQLSAAVVAGTQSAPEPKPAEQQPAGQAQEASSAEQERSRFG